MANAGPATSAPETGTPATKELSKDILISYRVAQAEMEKWAKVVRSLRGLIEEELGDSELGTYGGETVVRWSHTSSSRLDLSKLRENVDPAVLSSCYVQDNRRRFTTMSLWKALP